MKVVILAAGRGSRMEQYTQNTTKAMLLIEQKPMLEITIQRCIECGLRDFVIVVGYRKEDIINYFDKWLKTYKGLENEEISITFVEQEDIVAGTADAVGCVKNEFETNERFLLIYGDIVPTTKTIQQLILLDNDNNDWKMAVRRVDDPSKFGVVEVFSDYIINILEKTPNPPSNLVNAGLYTLDSNVFEYIKQTPRSPRGEYEFTTSLQLFINDKTHNKKLLWSLIDSQDNTLDIGTKTIYEKIINKN